MRGRLSKWGVKGPQELRRCGRPRRISDGARLEVVALDLPGGPTVAACQERRTRKGLPSFLDRQVQIRRRRRRRKIVLNHALAQMDLCFDLDRENVSGPTLPEYLTGITLPFCRRLHLLEERDDGAPR